MRKWQPSLKLLVLSNVLVGSAVILQTLAPFPFVAGIWFYSLLIGAGVVALIGIILAGRQGFVANKEQKQDVEERLEIKDKLEKQKQWDYTKFLLVISVVIIGGTTLYYWLHPEERPKS